MATTTTNLGLSKPAVNSATDEDLWGGQLNTNMDTLDSEAATKTVALNFADFELSRPKIKDYAETVSAHGATGTTETIDLENGNVHTITLDDNCTLTFSNPPATGIAGSFTLIVTQDGTGSRTITWPASVDWAGASAPTLSTGAGDVDILSFLTVDAGTTWYGFVGGLDFG